MTKFFQLDDDLAYSGSHMLKEDVNTWMERQQVLAQANEKATQIQSEAEERVRQAEEKAYEDAQKAVKSTLQDKAQAIEVEWCAKAQEEFVQIEQALPRLLQLALKKYLGELPQEDILKRVVAQTLKDPDLHSAMKVTVSREDIDKLKDLPELESKEIEADTDLKSGEFSVHSENSLVRTGLDQQLDELNRIIMGQESDV